MFRIIALAALLIFSLGCPSAEAQRKKSEVFKILGISVDATLSAGGSEPGAIIGNSGLKVGDEITIPPDPTHDQISRAIQRLWALHIFSDVQILFENKIEYRTQPLPRPELQRTMGFDNSDAPHCRRCDIKKNYPRCD